MDPQTAAIIQALQGGAPGSAPSPGGISPFAAQQSPNNPALQAYAMPQDPSAAPSGATGAPMGQMQPPGTGQNASMGDMDGLSLGAAPQGANMYSAMAQMPPVPNYWG